MGMTLIEKIIAHNIGREKVSPGEIVTVNVDRVMVHDIFIPFVAEKFEEMGFSKIWDPDRMVLIYDHLVPASQLDETMPVISQRATPLPPNTASNMSTAPTASAIS